MSLFSSKHIGNELINERLAIPVPICFQEGSKGLKSQHPTFETLTLTGHSLFQGIFRGGKSEKNRGFGSFSSQRCLEVLCYLLRCYFLNGCAGLCLIRSETIWFPTLIGQKQGSLSRFFSTIYGKAVRSQRDLAQKNRCRLFL